MVAKKGLGRGLDAMIDIPAKKIVQPDSSAKVEDNKAEVMININEIEPNREQPRKNGDQDILIE